MIILARRCCLKYSKVPGVSFQKFVELFWVLCKLYIFGKLIICRFQNFLIWFFLWKALGSIKDDFQNGGQKFRSSCRFVIFVRKYMCSMANYRFSRSRNPNLSFLDDLDAIFTSILDDFQNGSKKKKISLNSSLLLIIACMCVM